MNEEKTNPDEKIFFEKPEGNPEVPVTELAEKTQRLRESVDGANKIIETRIPEIENTETRAAFEEEAGTIGSETRNVEAELKASLGNAMREDMEEVPDTEKSAQETEAGSPNREEKQSVVELDEDEKIDPENPNETPEDIENKEDELESIEIQWSKEQIDGLLNSDCESFLRKLQEILRQNGKEAPERIGDETIFKIEEDGSIIFGYKTENESVSIKVSFLDENRIKIEMGTFDNEEEYDEKNSQEMKDFLGLFGKDGELAEIVGERDARFKRMMEEYEAFEKKTEEEKLEEVRMFKEVFSKDKNIESQEALDNRGKAIDSDLASKQEIFKQIYEANPDLLNLQNPDDIEKVNQFFSAVADKAEYFADLIMMRYKNSDEKDLIVDGKHINMLQAIEELRATAEILRKGIKNLTPSDIEAIKKSKSLLKYLLPGLAIILALLISHGKDVAVPAGATILGMGGFKLGHVALPIVAGKPAIGVLGMVALSALLGDKLDDFVENMTGVKIHPRLKSKKKE